MPAKIVTDWFDGLEAVLETESKLGGLLDHASTIGQAREFLVRRVLKTILPASVHIGSGIVIDHEGRASKQIDIIIYDPRFPMMNLDGGGRYFVEGVLATIEVKSVINNRETLSGSLDNCRSVLELNPVGEYPEEDERRIQFYMHKGGLSHEMAKHRFWYTFRPATYLFAFRSDLSIETTCECVTSWWNNINCRVSPYFPMLPRVLHAGSMVGIVNDGRFSLSQPDGTKPVMTLFKTGLRFRWLAIHLMDSVSSRLGLRNFAEQFDYRLTDYYPFDAYLQALQGANTKIIQFNPHTGNTVA
jgi:hypothetical protein